MNQKGGLHRSAFYNVFISEQTDTYWEFDILMQKVVHNVNRILATVAKSSEAQSASLIDNQ